MSCGGSHCGWLMNDKENHMSDDRNTGPTSLAGAKRILLDD